MRRRDFRAGYRKGYNAGFSDGWNMSMRCGTEESSDGCGRGHKDFPCRDDYVTGAELADEIILGETEEVD